jgi:excisionase family DNA binding protein
MDEAIAYPIKKAVEVSGETRTGIYEAIRDKELTARKSGRRTLIERAELLRWVSTLPTIGRDPNSSAAA